MLRVMSLYNLQDNIKYDIITPVGFLLMKLHAKIRKINRLIFKNTQSIVSLFKKEILNEISSKMFPRSSWQTEAGSQYCL